jgi:capsular exopolysaccharide synthesis family protein
MDLVMESPQAIEREEAPYGFSPAVVMLAEPNGARAEAIRTLRTHIVAQHVDDGRRGLAICAAGGGVGCTFTAVNLAVALSQVSVKTLLIDGNLRKPGLEAYIRPPKSSSGLHQYLVNTEMGFGDAIVDALPSLSLLYAGGAASEAQELLATDRFRMLIDHCLRDFDVTIIDTPPANRCADARRISTVVGYSLVVARRDRSFINDISVLAAQLKEDRAQVVGAVMNEA